MRHKIGSAHAAAVQCPRRFQGRACSVRGLLEGMGQWVWGDVWLQVSAHRMVLSHIDNDAVKALVDGVCARWKQFALPVPGTARKASGEFNEFKLSLRGATGLAHDAVSTLLRLPVLTELDVSGCSRISAMDKMRLVAKVPRRLRRGARPWACVPHKHIQVAALRTAGGALKPEHSCLLLHPSPRYTARAALDDTTDRKDRRKR